VQKCRATRRHYANSKMSASRRHRPGRFAQILVILGLQQVICFTISPPEIGEETARLVVRDNNSAKGLRETLSSPSSSSVQVVE
jgi:hypothetical protein